MTIQKKDHCGDPSSESKPEYGLQMAHNNNHLTQVKIMQAHDAANANENGTDALEPSHNSAIELVRKKLIGKKYHDIAQLDFVAELDANLAIGTEHLEEFLEDADAVQLRLAYLRELRRTTLDYAPMGLLLEPADFVRELFWIATGVLSHAVTSGMLGSDAVYRLSLFASNPEVLEKAHLSAVKGESEVVELIDQHRLKIWDWLRDEVVSGRLFKWDEKSVVGKYIAAWQVNESYRDLEIADEPDLAVDSCATRWMIPVQLVAVTFVDPN